MTHAALAPIASAELFSRQRVEGHVALVRSENCVRPLNVPRSLAGVAPLAKGDVRPPGGRFAGPAKLASRRSVAQGTSTKNAV